jgi:peptidoglycan/xylan/chitin deacetylase (PgdA/CDA1 family)
VRLTLITAAVIGLAVVPLALASRSGPEAYRRPHVPTQLEQRRALSLALARGQPIYCGGRRSNAVALTFDDGPGEYTKRLIAMLRAAGAHATFFVVGNRLHYWPGVARADESVGVVGDHSWSHAHLTQLPRWLGWLELVRTQYALQQELGHAPLLFRAPYEEHNQTLDTTVASVGLLEVFWSVASGDDQPKATARKVVRNVLAGLRPGAIVLMHDIHPWTLRAMPQILRAIRLRGLRAVTIPELLALDAPAVHQGCPLAPGVD